PDSAPVAAPVNAATSWRGEAWGGAWTGHTEAFASHWSLRGFAGRDNYTLLGVVPVARYTFDGGRSPWFLEGGIGASVLDSKVNVPDKVMSTHFNFYDVIAAGRGFGEGRRQEISLRLTHI
ncbi:MAG: acyloxyacyl hydrolase, partial [Ramlibacter sp.]